MLSAIDNTIILVSLPVDGDLIETRGQGYEIRGLFDFITPDDIRLKGSRIGIESVLYEYIHRARSPDAIAARFPSLTTEQIYATILYYLHNRKEVDVYLTEWLEHGSQMRKEQDREPPPIVVRLRTLEAERQKNCF